MTNPTIYLPILRIEIADNTTVHVGDPNSIIMQILEGSLDIKGMEPCVGWNSALTDAPALQYRCSDIVVELTPDEMDRFIRHDLKPDEYLKLRDLYPYREPDIYDLHDDFYHLDTGEALQPMRK